MPKVKAEDQRGNYKIVKHGAHEAIVYYRGVDVGKLDKILKDQKVEEDESTTVLLGAFTLNWMNQWKRENR